MKRILIWNSGITLLVTAICSYLLLEELIPAWPLPFVIFAIAALYAISIDSFWRKISNSDHDEKHLRQLIKMLIKHRKDNRTLRVILDKISSQEMQYVLGRNFSSVARELIQGDTKHRHDLCSVVRTVCDLVRDRAVKRFQEDVKSLSKDHVLHRSNQEFIKLFNEKTILCFLEAGGYPTWGDVGKVLLPIFEGVSKEDADKFLLTVEECFRPERTRAFEYLQVEGAYRQLMQSLRRQVIERK